MPREAAAAWLLDDGAGKPAIAPDDLRRVEPPLAFLICHNLRQFGEVDVSTDWDPGYEIGWALALAHVENHNFAFPTQTHVLVRPGSVVATRPGRSREFLLHEQVQPLTARDPLAGH